MARIASNSTQNFIQRYAVIVVAVMMSMSIGIYVFNFSGNLSDDQDTWGQFGDFLGGVVNPIVGFMTIWLLTISLKQSLDALQQSREELELTRDAVVDARKMQEATENALKKQIAIAEHARDIDVVLSIWKSLDEKYTLLGQEYKKHKTGASSKTGFDVLVEWNKVKSERDLYEKILSVEKSRLINMYMPECNTNSN
ncbi:MAG: hypothetical protein Q7T48_20350 [Cellvibrio sp.]|uniref:hypothetical protein n=1 Tax=Cellvibrio sp. TaxID=1965322 RepID=UPI002726A0D9|nr:hypothetical protein [Cellvibrio sp.]